LNSIKIRINRINSLEYNPQESDNTKRFQETHIHVPRFLLNDAFLNFKFYENEIKIVN